MHFHNYVELCQFTYYYSHLGFIYIIIVTATNCHISQWYLKSFNKHVINLIIVLSFYSTVGKLGVNLQLQVWPRYFPTNLTNLSEGIFECNDCIFILYFKGCSLHLCGSSSNGFGSDSSDADFCFQLRHMRQVRFMYMTFSSTFRSSFLGMPYYFFVRTMYT